MYNSFRWYSFHTVIVFSLSLSLSPVVRVCVCVCVGVDVCMCVCVFVSKTIIYALNTYTIPFHQLNAWPIKLTRV